jgi:hypothetical protein
MKSEKETGTYRSFESRVVRPDRANKGTDLMTGSPRFARDDGDKQELWIASQARNDRNNRKIYKP